MLKKTTTVEEYHDHGSLRVTQPLMLRLLEWAKTDAKDDNQLHQAVEKMATMDHYRALNIEDFDSIIPPTTA